MSETPPLACLLYHSRLADHADIGCVGAIVRTARQFNQEAGITGMLVFDGQRFCQYIEGPAGPLQALTRRIAQDPRHTEFTIQHQGPAPAERIFAQWSMAYMLVDDEEPLDYMVPLRGEPALHHLHTLLPMLDAA